MNSSSFKKGDILEATHREIQKGYHYIIFFEKNSKNDFCGCMITHSHDDDNISMSSEHFKVFDEKGNKYKVIFDNSFLVKQKFLKSEDWGPFKKVGELTNRGINFLDLNISKIGKCTFSNYFKQKKVIL